MNNNFKFILFLLTLGLFMTSCEKEEETFGDLTGETRGTIINFSGSTPGFFNLSDASNSTNSFSFSNAPLGESLSSAVLTVSFNGSNPVEVESVTVDGSYTMSLEQAASITGVAISDLMAGDVFSVGFNMSTASGDYRNTKTLDIAVSCLSELAGTYNYEATAVWCGNALTSGQVTFTEAAAGVYTLDDFSLGGYTSCYGGLAASWGTLAITDVCNELSIGGEDNYGDGWTFAVDAVSGAALTVSWTNDYGETGSAIITRPDGSAWPDLF